MFTYITSIEKSLNVPDVILFVKTHYYNITTVSDVRWTYKTNIYSLQKKLYFMYPYLIIFISRLFSHKREEDF